MKINSKELNKLKLRSSRMKALGEGMNFSFGTSSKSLGINVNNFKTKLLEMYPQLLGLYWEQLYTTPSEIASSQYPHIKDWEFLAAKTISSSPKLYQAKPARACSDAWCMNRSDPVYYIFVSAEYNAFVLFNADNVRNNPELFKNDFKSSFGVDYDTWNSRNSTTGDWFFSIAEK